MLRKSFQAAPVLCSSRQSLTQTQTRTQSWPPVLCSRAFSAASPSPPPPVSGSILANYKADVTVGSLQYDENQYQVLRYLSRLCDHLGKSYVKTPLPASEQGRSNRTVMSDLQRGNFGRAVQAPRVVHYTGKYSATAQPTEMTSTSEEMVATVAAAAEAAAALKAAQVQAALDAEINMETASSSSSSRVVKGVYVHGNVGTGKTLLMDTFFEACPLPDDKKRRVHFHQFLLEIHARIRAFKLGLIEKHGRDVRRSVVCACVCVSLTCTHPIITITTNNTSLRCSSISMYRLSGMR